VIPWAKMPSEEVPEPVEVPYGELPADLLNAVIESFVLREGTDYGEKELSLEDKVARVIRQLKRGEAKILFDPESESVTIAVRQNSR
jgi:uncharacterized protein YheU (UPF0270 family)